MRWLGVAVGIGVGFALSPTPAVLTEQVVETITVTVLDPEGVGLMCTQAASGGPWVGPLEPLEDRTDCTIEMLAIMGWELSVGTIGVVNDWADVMYGGPCGAVAHYREYGSW